MNEEYEFEAHPNVGGGEIGGGVRYRNIGMFFSKYRKKKIANIGISESTIVNIIEFTKYRISECV